MSSLKVQPAGTQACAPGAGQVAFFEDNEFQGRCVVRGIGEYANSAAIGLANDSISSVRLGPNMQAVVCKDDNFAGDCLLLSGHIPAMGATRIGNDQVSSVKVQPAGTQACLPGDGQVAFYEHDQFQGRCVVRGIGEYPNPSAMGLANDTMSSVRVGKAVEAIVCTGALYAIDCVRLAADTPNLGSVRHMNDQASSARVVPRGQQDCPAGPGQAALFEHADFVAPCKVLGVGEWTDMSSTGVRDKSVTSVRVAQGVHVCLYSTAGFTTPAADLARDTPNVGGPINDVTSSVRVRPVGKPCDGPATGASGASDSHPRRLPPVVTQSLEPDPQNVFVDRLHVQGSGFIPGDTVTFVVGSTVGGKDMGAQSFPATPPQANSLGMADGYLSGPAGVCAATKLTVIDTYGYGKQDATHSATSEVKCGGDQPAAPDAH